MGRLTKYINEGMLDNADDSFGKQFFSAVAKKLGGKLKKYTFSKNRENRVIEIDAKIASFELHHEWRRDGSETKPVTDIVLLDAMTDTGESQISLGRFAIWDDPKEYAEDLMIVFKEKLDQ